MSQSEISKNFESASVDDICEEFMLLIISNINRIKELVILSDTPVVEMWAFLNKIKEFRNDKVK